MQAETKRQIEHMVPVAFAVLLRWLPLWAAAALAALSVVYGGLVSPRLFPRTLREDEAALGFSPGKIIYGSAVLVMILVFGERSFHVVAGAWALMGIGDGMSNIIGRALGRAKIPWCREKSWEGVAAFVCFGTVASGLLIWWVSGRENIEHLTLKEAMLFGMIASYAAAFIETLPSRWVDDNLTVPATAAVVLYLATAHFFDWTLSLFVALALNFILGFAAYRAAAVSKSGLAAGLIIGAAIALNMTLPGFVVLAAMFLLGSAATRVGYAKKAATGIAQEKGGRRDWLNAVAKCSVAVACALATIDCVPWVMPTMALGFAAALAAATMDTVSSELGPLYGRVTVLPPTFRRVPPGTEGAVSLEGTLLGLAGAVIIAGLVALVGLVSWRLSWLPVAGAFAGTTVESLLGALGLGHSREASAMLNLICTAVAAAVAILIGGLP